MLTGITSWGLLCTVICTLSCLLIKNLKLSEARSSFLVSLWSALEHKVCDWNSKHHSKINKTTTLKMKPLVFQHLPDALNELNQLNFNEFKLCWERGLRQNQINPLCWCLSTTCSAQVLASWEHLPTNAMCMAAHGTPSLDSTLREAQEMQNTPPDGNAGVISEPSQL